LFDWRHSLPIDQWAIKAFHLKGHDVAFVAIPFFWCWLALLLTSLIAGGRAIATNSPLRRAALCGVTPALALAIIAGIEMVAMAKGRP
jgi:hypothetical protein